MTCVRYTPRVLLLLRYAAILIAHSGTRPGLYASPLNVVSWAHFDALSAIRFIFISKGDVSFIQLMPCSVRILLFPTCLVPEHHSHDIVTFCGHGCLTFFAVFIARLAILAAIIKAASFAQVLLHLALSVFPRKNGVAPLCDFLTHPAKILDSLPSLLMYKDWSRMRIWIVCIT